MLGTTAQQHDMTDTKYKHTELGPIPQHWEIGRLANYFTERREKVSDKEFAPLSVTKNGVLPQLENVAKSNDSENRKGVRKGDFVINSRSDRKGSSGVSDRDGSVSLINIVLTPRKSINTAYCNYLLKSQNFIEEFYRYGRGIVADLWTTRYSEMKLMKLAIPPLDEQEAMVAYLDEQTGKIDAAIEREQKMIDLLEERKQIIIQQAVTKGLNPNAPLKDSGIEWIGAIPESWRKKRFKYLFKTSTGITFTKAQLESEGNPVLSYGQVHSKLNKSGTLNKELIKFIPNSLTAGKDNCLVYNGDFIFADTSEDFEGCGNNIYVDTEYPVYAGYHTIIARKQNDEYGKYLGYLFASKAWRGQVRTRVNGVKVYSITQGILNGSWVILPPKAEQIAIAEYLDKVIGVIDKEEAHRNRLISLLRERKQIIVNEVVTGKIKVS